MSGLNFVIHTTAGISPSGGGTSRVIIDLLDSLADDTEFSPLLITQASPGNLVLESANPAVRRNINTSSFWVARKFGLPFSGALRAALQAGDGRIVHNHGVWTPVNHWTSRLAEQFRCPLVTQPHGMLEPWATNHKRWKKRLAMSLYQIRDLESARALVVTAESEYSNLRQMGLKQPIAVIPNGVNLPEDMASKHTLSEGREIPRTVLFLSRIQEVKGLPNLVEAWARLRPVGWRLKIAGPDEAGHLGKVLALVGQLRVEESVDYVGEVDDKAKSSLYRQADLFVLPTFSENFGVVVAEALAHGLPVITTKGAPWEDLVTYGCGWWIDIGVGPLVDALRVATALTDRERRAMGQRGRIYVRRYNWTDIAKDMAALYRWVLCEGGRPSCVRLD